MDYLLSGNWYETLIDRGLVPDFLLRYGVRMLSGTRVQRWAATSAEGLQREKMAFVKTVRELPVAIHTDKANEQHYEVPTEFIQMCLGKRMKYSCCLFEPGADQWDLDAAEEAMLSSYAEKARITDGMSIFDVGCGWGSLCLYMAEKFPSSKVYALSNSKTQKKFIDGVAKERGFGNLIVFTDDVSAFNTKLRFDRILSIEMLERMRGWDMNYPAIFKKISSWLKDDGLFFAHVFTHRTEPYHFEVDGNGDWMSKYFFTGGTMPSNDLFLYFQEDLRLVDQWCVNGKHYGQTSECWLRLLDKNRDAALASLQRAYGDEEGAKWFQRWRLFYIAVAEFFALKDGNEWMVMHYLFEKQSK